MLGIRFFKLPKAKQFDYKPVFYDPLKEVHNQNLKQTNASSEFAYKENIKGSFQKNIKKTQKTDVRNANIRLIIIIVGLGILAIYFFLS